jgi:hypothetical protein
MTIFLSPMHKKSPENYMFDLGGRKKFGQKSSLSILVLFMGLFDYLDTFT